MTATTLSWCDVPPDIKDLLRSAAVLLVGLITLIMVTPALFTFAMIWYYHLQYVQQSLPHFSITPILHSLTLVAVGFFFLFPVWITYQSYQSAQLKQKVARLERLWQQSI